MTGFLSTRVVGVLISERKDGFPVKNLSEDKVCQLAMSPLYVLYLVVSEHIAPEQISERHIVRSVECGLKWQLSLSEGIFELLRSNLHEFHEKFPRDYTEQGRERWRAELLSAKDVFDIIAAPPVMIADFKEALTGLVKFVARGGAFRQKLQNPAMQRQAEWVEGVLA